MQQVGEPSVEDILESIKKVIARDAPRGAPRPVADRLPERAAPTPEPRDDARDDVLDLATVAALDSKASAEQPLTANAASTSMRESLAALAMLAQPSAPPRIVRSDETSLEGLTRELLKPALTEWLDKNLPAMVERMVAAEIARIVGKKS